jgi:hypothetical protein
MPKLPSLKLTRKSLIAIGVVLLVLIAVGGFLAYQENEHQKKLAEIEENKLENKIIKASLKSFL